MSNSTNNPSHETDFASMLEAYLGAPNHEQGELTIGTIVEISSEGLLVDLGLKREGLVPTSDLTRAEVNIEQYKAGDEIEVLVTVPGHGSKSPILSVYQAVRHQSWKDAEESLNSGEVVTGTVDSFNRGGIIVTYLDLPGFVPASHISGVTKGIADNKRKELLESLVGKEISVRVIEVDRQRHRLVLSQRAAQRSLRAEQKDKLISELTLGQVLKGTIINVRDFGAFVDLGAADGLIHVSELAWQQVEHPKNIVEPGDQVDVMVISIDQKKQRIGLSMKQLLPSPWDTIGDRLAPGKDITGSISRILDFGVFVSLGEGIEGLLHNSMIPDEGAPIMEIGNELDLTIVTLDIQRHRVSLSLQSSSTKDNVSQESNEIDNNSVDEVLEADQNDASVTEDSDNTNVDNASTGGELSDESDN